MALVTPTTQSLPLTETSEDCPYVNAKKNYALYEAAGTNTENQRLDETHEAIKFCFGGRLSMAPLEDLIRPTAILDVGAGSGAWATQAAETFPEAEVIAVDLISLPPREYPHNLYFKQIDLSSDFSSELKEATFDIVHAQLVFVHLPNPNETFRRVARLVKPGGWLIINEVVNWMRDDTGLGPGQTELYSRMEERMTSKGMDPFVAQKLRTMMRSLGFFQEINLMRIAAPVSQRHEASYDESFRRLGQVVASSQRSLLSPLVSSLGAAEELIRTCEEELDDSNRNMFFYFYFMWSKRKVV